MFDLTLPQANFFYHVANVAIVVGAFLVLAGTLGANQMGYIKERFADERISANEVETARAKENAALANVEAARATERAAATNLELARFKQPRVLDTVQQDRIRNKLKPFAGIPFDLSLQLDSETIGLMEQVGASLKAAGLIWKGRSHGSPVFTQPGSPPAGIVAFTGIMIQIDSSKTYEWDKAVVAIKDALSAEGLEVQSMRIIDGTETPDAIHIYIGRKPHE